MPVRRPCPTAEEQIAHLRDHARYLRDHAAQARAWLGEAGERIADIEQKQTGQT